MCFSDDSREKTNVSLLAYVALRDSIACMGFVDTVKGHVKDVVLAVLEDERTEAAVRRLVAQVVLPVIPVAIGAAVDRAFNRATDLDQDGRPDIAEVVDAAKSSIDKLLPPGITLPVIGDVGEFLGGLFPNFNRPS